MSTHSAPPLLPTNANLERAHAQDMAEAWPDTPSPAAPAEPAVMAPAPALAAPAQPEKSRSMPAVRKDKTIVFEHPLGDLRIAVSEVLISEHAILVLGPAGDPITFAPNYGIVFVIRVNGGRYKVSSLHKGDQLVSQLFACQVLALARVLENDQDGKGKS